VRVLILTIYHDPEPIPKTGELARELQRRGHTVSVVTSLPHYPSGRLYPGYRLRPWHREVREGVPTLRTFIYPYHGSNAVLRMVNYCSWMLSSMLAAWLTPPCDVIYVWHPPLTVGVTAYVLSTLKRAPFVYDVQDLWPESALASGLLHDGRLVTCLYRLADWVYKRADRILVVSAAAAKHLHERGVDSMKVVVANHWIDHSLFQAAGAGDEIRAKLELQGRFLVMFAGNLGLVQGLETLIEAAALLRDRRDIVIVLVGDGSDRGRLERLAADRALENVRFVGRHPADAMPDFFAAADALLVHLKPSTIAEHAIPTKILAYLAAGRAIVCAMPGAAAELVRNARAGLVVEAGNPVELASAIRAIAELPSDVRDSYARNARQYVREHFDKSRVIDAYEAILDEVASRAATRPRHHPSRST
jgi:colanic acid biosynthesis glycosyl transferase WcaI